MTIFSPDAPTAAHDFPCYLLGHRGARAEKLENSESGFRHAQALAYQDGLDGIEFDVQMTADCQLVVVHDEQLTRLTQRQSFIQHMTLAELDTLTQSDWARFNATHDDDFLYQPILPLVKLLPYLQGYRHIELEVKTHPATDYLALACALFQVLHLSSWAILPITVTSFDTEFLSTWHRVSQGLQLPTGLLLAAQTRLPHEIAFLPHTSRFISDICNRACRLGCGQIGVYFGLITPDVIEIAHRYGLRVTAWTVNDINLAKTLMDWHIDTLITDYPSRFLAALRE